MSYSDDLADGLQKLRGSQKFCDVVLIAEDTEFYCHKVVLSALSEFFETMFDSPFKVCLYYIDTYKAGTHTHIYSLKLHGSGYPRLCLV